MNGRTQEALNRAEITAIGAGSDWQLVASAVVTGNGKNWVASGPTAFSGMMATTGNGSYAEP